MTSEEKFDKEFDFERYKQLKNIVVQLGKEDKELLERLGSDYDENGIPYWNKTDGQIS
jgi:L-2-hydroxyglutarate oxidase LhgO